MALLTVEPDTGLAVLSLRKISATTFILGEHLGIFTDDRSEWTVLFLVCLLHLCFFVNLLLGVLFEPIEHIPLQVFLVLQHFEYFLTGSVYLWFLPECLRLLFQTLHFFVVQAV